MLRQDTISNMKIILAHYTPSLICTSSYQLGITYLKSLYLLCRHREVYKKYHWWAEAGKTEDQQKTSIYTNRRIRPMRNPRKKQKLWKRMFWYYLFAIWREPTDGTNVKRSLNHRRTRTNACGLKDGPPLYTVVTWWIARKLENRVSNLKRSSCSIPPA